MVNNVLDHIISPDKLDTLHGDIRLLRAYFKEKFDPIKDHTGFFFPGKFLTSI